MPLGVVHTDIADIEDDELLYRGRRARDLVERPFAEIVAWLWDAERVDAPDPAIGAPGRWWRAASARRGHGPPPRRAHRLRRRRSPAARRITGHAAPHRMDAADRTPVALGGDPDPDIALSLTRAWNAPASVGPAVNAALVLLIDHDLAVSTFAARVAASARADGYAAVSAALGAADSPLHISAATRTARLLTRVRRGLDPERAGRSTAGRQRHPGLRPSALSRRRRPRRRPVPVHRGASRRGGDDGCRAPALGGRRRAGAAAAQRGSGAGRAGIGARLPEDAASTIFVIGRLAGWIAHIAAEYAEPAMRLRPRGEYVGR